MNDLTRMVSQLDKLIAEYDALAARSKYDDLSDLKVESGVLANRLQAAIDRMTVPGSAYAKRADLQRGEVFYARLDELHHIAIALRDDLNDGWIDSIVELVHADTFSDYLDMATELLGKKFKDAAAVITGTSLEVHVRALCVKNGVDTEDATGKPKQADTMNVDLKKAGVYEALQQKQLTAWMDLRNNAAHGNYDKYDVAEVRQFIEGVRGFMLKYPA